MTELIGLEDSHKSECGDMFFQTTVDIYPGIELLDAEDEQQAVVITASAKHQYQVEVHNSHFQDQLPLAESGSDGPALGGTIATRATPEMGRVSSFFLRNERSVPDAVLTQVRSHAGNLYFSG